MSTATYIPARRRKEVKYTMAQKKASVLFKKHNIEYIPIENVLDVTYGSNRYYIRLRSEGLLILKLNS